MSRLQQIDLLQFKNHTQSRYVFTHRVTAITGPNGAGKTNLLDAIYYLCFARSYFIKGDGPLTTRGQNGFRVSGSFDKEGQEYKVACIVREDGAKEISCNDELFKRLSGFIGRFSCVMVSPDDIALVNETSDVRRRFMDTILCQTSAGYLQNLQQYNKVLVQRNSALKQFAESGRPDAALLQIYNRQLVQYGVPLYEARKALCQRLFTETASYYQMLAGHADGMRFEYSSPLNGADFAELLAANLQKDLVLQRTRYGPHRDDLVLLLDEMPVKQTASQGQKKTLLLALKLAELSILNSELQTPPLLLLDDIFEKLDTQRLQKLVHFIAYDCSSAVFLTDTSEARVQLALEAAGVQAGMINITNAPITSD